MGQEDEVAGLFYLCEALGVGTLGRSDARMLCVLVTVGFERRNRGPLQR